MEHTCSTIAVLNDSQQAFQLCLRRLKKPEKWLCSSRGYATRQLNTCTWLNAMVARSLDHVTLSWRRTTLTGASVYETEAILLGLQGNFLHNGPRFPLIQHAMITLNVIHMLIAMAGLEKGCHSFWEYDHTYRPYPKAVPVNITDLEKLIQKCLDTFTAFNKNTN